MKKYFFLVFAVLIFTPFSFAEDLTITTYYPSPYGVYRELRLWPNNPAPSLCSNTNEGSMYYQSDSVNYQGKLMMCKQTASSTFAWQEIGGVPTGAIMAFSLSACPTGWALADGTSGTPDLRGVFIRGLDNGRGLDPARTLGSYQLDDLKAHTHTYHDMVYNNSIDGVDSVTTYSDEHHDETRNTGSTGGTETRPKNVAFIYCIKQ